MDDRRADDECAVCLEPTANRLYPCQHLVCTSCEHEWHRRSHACPLCRQLVVCTDVHVARTPRDRTKYANLTLKVDFPPNSFAGVTLQNSAWFPELVYIKRLHAADRAALCGLKRGDYLLAIDGMPVTSHEVGVRLVEHASRTQQSIDVHVRRFRWRTALPLSRAVADAHDVTSPRAPLLV